MIVTILARMEERRSAFSILTGTLTGKRSLGRPRRKCEDTIRMVLKSILVIGVIRLRIRIIGEPL